MYRYIIEQKVKNDRKGYIIYFKCDTDYKGSYSLNDNKGLAIQKEETARSMVNLLDRNRTEYSKIYKVNIKKVGKKYFKKDSVKRNEKISKVDFTCTNIKKVIEHPTTEIILDTRN